MSKQETIWHVHQSGKVGKVHATADQWLSMLDAHAALADVITLTETPTPEAGRTIALWARARGWYMWRPKGYGPDECTILSREPITNGRARRLTRLTLRGARRAPIYDVSGLSFGVRWHVWHSPAHNGGLAPSWPTRVYFSALSVMHRLRGKWRVVTGDWNVDLRRPSIRARLRLRGLHWAVNPHQLPTLDGRVVEGDQTNLKVTHSPVTLPACEGFDHHAIRTGLAIPAGVDHG